MRPYLIRNCNDDPLHPHIECYHLHFKVPRDQDLEAFLEDLRRTDVEGRGTFCVSEDKNAADEWWYRLVFLLTKEQKYWEGRKKGRR